MNRPKTNVYQKHCDISNGKLSITSPKNWYPISAAQVDISILTSYGQRK